MRMKKVSTAELKARLSEYLGMVRKGETVYITSHRNLVAQLSPTQLDEALQVYQPDVPMSELRNVQGIEPASGVDGVENLLADRGRR